MHPYLPITAVVLLGSILQRDQGRRDRLGACSVKVQDSQIDYFGDGPEGTYRVTAHCHGREVGQIQVTVDPVAPRTPRCGRNAAAQRREYRLHAVGTASTSWAGLDPLQRRTGLGTRMYQAALEHAHSLGVPLVPDACVFDAYGDPGETSDDAWRVWQSKLDWKGRTNRKMRPGTR